jgi:hypothetical protein
VERNRLKVLATAKTIKVILEQVAVNIRQAQRLSYEGLKMNKRYYLTLFIVGLILTLVLILMTQGETVHEWF